MKASKKYYYAVWKGWNTGVYSTWEQCERNIHGYRGAKYKKYNTLEEAKQSLEIELKNEMRYLTGRYVGCRSRY